MTQNIALVGCGAIARAFYQPALEKHRERFGHIWVVDPGDRAREQAASNLLARQARKLADVDDDVQLVIIAAPNALHFPLACEALLRGAHVLVEKPFVICPEDGETLVQLAASQNRIVAVNQTRRFTAVAAALHTHIRRGEFGRLLSISHSEGSKLRWPFESGTAFSKGAHRTGVIMDIGVHAIDLHHYLLQPKWAVRSATHDGFEGPEGLAEMYLLANGAPVSIRLSRYQEQRNSTQMTFESAEVSFNVHDPYRYSVRSRSGKTMPIPALTSRFDGESTADRVLLNFVAAAQGAEAPVCSADSSLPVINVLDQIYRMAKMYCPDIGVT